MRPGASPLSSMADGMLRALRPEIATADGELPAAEVARLRVLIDASEDGLAAAAREVALLASDIGLHTASLLTSSIGMR